MNIVLTVPSGERIVIEKDGTVTADTPFYVLVTQDIMRERGPRPQLLHPWMSVAREAAEDFKATLTCEGEPPGPGGHAVRGGPLSDLPFDRPQPQHVTGLRPPEIVLTLPSGERIVIEKDGSVTADTLFHVLLTQDLLLDYGTLRYLPLPWMAAAERAAKVLHATVTYEGDPPPPGKREPDGRAPIY